MSSSMKLFGGEFVFNSSESYRMHGPVPKKDHKVISGLLRDAWKKRWVKLEVSVPTKYGDRTFIAKWDSLATQWDLWETT